MKKEFSFSISKKQPAERKKMPVPEEITLYGQGAGLYSCLRTLSQNAVSRKTGQQTIELRQ